MNSLWTGNVYLAQALQRVIIPLLAFVVLRIRGSFSIPGTVEGAIAQHREMLAAVRIGDPAFAEQRTREMIGEFRAFTSTMISADGTGIHPAD